MVAVAGAVAMTWWPRDAAPQTSRVRRIGVLVAGSQTDPEWRDRYAVVLDELRRLGWTPEQNLAIDWRFSEGISEALPRLARELVLSPVDVVVVNSAGLAAVAREATSSLPIIVTNAGDLEGAGLIESLRHPGGNITGTQLLNPELMGKRIDLLRQLIPNLAHLGVIEPITPAAIITEHYIQVIGETARALNVEVHRVSVHRPEDFAHAFADLVQANVGAALVIANPLSVSNRAAVISAAEQSHLAAMYETQSFVNSGGLISYGVDLSVLLRAAAGYIDKVLRGANPADLPVQQPTKFELAINLKTAKTLGLVVPQSLLLRADKVIE
jgi:putative ABC transport system substrate-binding protein